LGRELKEAETQLAQDFLRELAPYQTGGEIEPYIEILVKHMHILAFSPLNVTTSSNSLAH
jgi:hypothetical protein